MSSEYFGTVSRHPFQTASHIFRNSLLKQPGDEDPDEGVRDLLEMLVRKLDMDKDGRVSLDDYK